VEVDGPHERARRGVHDPRGDAVSVPFGPTAVQEDQTYYLFVSAPQGPLSLAGATVSNENWDEGLPLRLEGRDPFGGLYNGLTMEMHWFDNEDKRQMLVRNLATVDYIILPSQRRLWASTRLPNFQGYLIAHFKEHVPHDNGVLPRVVRRPFGI